MKERVEQVRQQRTTAARGRDRRMMRDGRHRRLHERRQVDAAQRARRQRGRAGRGQAVRDARPDVAPGQARRRPDRDRHRHRRLHPQAAAPARRRVPGDARGGQPGRRPASRSSTRPIPTCASTGRPSRRSSTSSGAGDKPRLVAFNKADLVETAAPNGDAPAPALAGSVLVSALTGFGLDTLRAEIAALLASLWVDVDVHIPYAAGELLARVRERGTVELEYGERDVRVSGRAAPALAGELTARRRAGPGTLASTATARRDGDRDRA